MPVDPRHLSAVRELIDTALAALADAQLAVDAATRELADQGAHPAVVAGMYRVRDQVRGSFGLAGAAAWELGTVRAAYAAQLGQVAPTLPTEGERTGGAYIGRQAAAQGVAQGVGTVPCLALPGQRCPSPCTCSL